MPKSFLISNRRSTSSGPINANSAISLQQQHLTAPKKASSGQAALALANIAPKSFKVIASLEHLIVHHKYFSSSPASAASHHEQQPASLDGPAIFIDQSGDHHHNQRHRNQYRNCDAVRFEHDDDCLDQSDDNDDDNDDDDDDCINNDDDDGDDDDADADDDDYTNQPIDASLKNRSRLQTVATDSSNTNSNTSSNINTASSNHSVVVASVFEKPLHHLLDNAQRQRHINNNSNHIVTANCIQQLLNDSLTNYKSSCTGIAQTTTKTTALTTPKSTPILSTTATINCNNTTAIQCSTNSSSNNSISSSNNNNNSNNNVHICHECGKQYSTSSNLARHRQTHRSVTDKKAKKCPDCDKIYVSMPAFSMHLRTHNQGCLCSICGKSFSRPWLLQGHMRTHTGEKPFECSICNKAFADKSNLRAHIQTHSSMKPYICKRCNKAFALKSYLYKHEESTCMKMEGGRKEPLNLKNTGSIRRNNNHSTTTR